MAGSATFPQAIVVGAGIAGMAAAIQLRQLGYQVQVLEQAPELGEVGAGIQLAPNATRVLQHLGVLDELRPFAVAPEGVVWRRWADGVCLTTDKLGADAEVEFGTPYWHVHRADLHRVLVEVATARDDGRPAVEIALGSQVVEVVTEDDSGVTIATADGGRHRAHLVLGADGIHSKVRGWFGAVDSPAYSGDAAFRALVPTDKVKASPWLAGLIERPVTTLWVGPRRHVVHYEIRGRRLLNLVALVNTPTQPTESWMVGASVGDLVDAFSGWDDRLLDVFSMAEDIKHSGIYDRRPLATWTRGRVALLGDACHAMLPYRAQGAAQALEDVAVLGRTLDGTEDGQIPEALRRYEQIRKPQATAVQDASRESQSVLHLDDGEAQQARDTELDPSTKDDAYERYRWIWTPTEGESN